MAKKNGRTKKSSENNDAPRVAVGEEGTADAMGNRDSKDSIKFSSWSQTDNDVTITLHTGRNFSNSEISVDFTDQDVKVGLTDGRKWSCSFNQTVIKDSARVQLKKMKLLLIVKKKDPCVNWTSYEKVDEDSASLSESDSSAKANTCFEIKSLIKAKCAVSDSEYGKVAAAQIASELPPGHAEHSGKKSQSKTNPVRLNSPGKDARPQRPFPQIGSGDEAAVVDDSAKALGSGKTLTTQPLPFLTTGEDTPNSSRKVMSYAQPQDVVSSSDGQSMTPTSFFDNELISEAVESMDCEETDSLLSSPPLVPDASKCQKLKKDGDEIVGQMDSSDLQTGDDGASELSLLISCEENEPKADLVDLTEAMPNASSNMEIDEASADVRDLDLVKHDFYERGDVVVLTVYVKEINRETLRVIYGESTVEIVFQTSEPKFLHSYEGATANTYFRWKLNLASTIVEDKCNSRLAPITLAINLYKKVSKKWGNLTALPQLNSASAPTTRDTWMPTCQNEGIGTSSGSGRQRQPGTVAFDELSSASSKASQHSISSGYEDGSYTGRKDLTSMNKPTCKVSPLTSSYGSSYGSSYITSSSSSFKQSAAVANPGMTGLDNIGNTCFMNSVLQVLANTIDLKDYFLDGTYQREINCDNPLGMGGKLAMAFGYLLKVLWTSNQSSFEPSKLKNLVATKQTRFVGFSQHDAEEFMEFLLDGLHEDLNRVQEKPYFEDKDITGESDEVIANESWRRHKLRNDSHIVDVFQGQYHSRVVCPACETVSITFDPFSIIQVPIPKEKKLIRVIFMSTVASNRPIKFPIQIGVDANVNHLKDALYQRTRVRPENMRILKVSQSQISSEFTPGMSLQEITSRDLLVACAVLSKNDIGEPVREFTVVQRTVLPKTVPPCCNFCHKENSSNLVLKRCTKCYTASYCNQDCQKKDWNKHKLLCQLQGEPVGCPFIISIPESKMTFAYMCSTIESYARYSVNAFQPPPLARKALSSRSSITSSVSSLSSSSSVSEQSEEMEVVSDPEIPGSPNEISDSIVPPGESTVKTESDVGSKEDAASVNKSEAESGSSQPPVRCVLGTQQNSTPAPPPPFFLRPCTRNGTVLNSYQRIQDSGTDLLELDTCRSLLVEWKNKEDCIPYVEVETKELEYEECESKFQTGNNANISYNNDITLHDCLNLFTEPEVLHPDQTWFCSKCKVHRQATKEISIWRLPPTLIIHLKRFSFSSMFWRNKIDDKVTFPLSGLDMTPYLKRSLAPGESPPIYDLYGVINHKGDLVGGHYTAFAQCPDPEDFAKSEVGWRYFDDSNVTTFDARNVNSQFAYVLFYRKRNAGLTFNENARMKLTAAVSDIPKIITNGYHAIKNTAASIRDEKLDNDDVLVMDTSTMDASGTVVELENVRVESEDEDSGEKVGLRCYADNIEMHAEGKDMNAVD